MEAQWKRHREQVGRIREKYAEIMPIYRTELCRWPSLDSHDALNRVSAAISSMHGAEKSRKIQEATRALENLERHLDEMEKDLAKPHRLEPPQELGLHEFMENVRFALKNGVCFDRPVSIRLSRSLQDARARIFEKGILQSLEVFIRNALRAKRQAGSDQNVNIWATVRHGNLVVQVKDKGIGIGYPDRGRIFKEKFSLNRDTDGHGIGLMAVKEMIEDHHGGQVFFRSGPGKGSTFGFRIPLANESEGRLGR